MLSLAHNTRIYVYLPAADLRKSFDGLTGLIRSAFVANPRDGSWFLFFNKRRDRLKILSWEPDGFSIWYKRLTVGCFRFPALLSEVLHIKIRTADLITL